MILYYAMGGGLGHLVRARAVAHTLGIEDRVTIVSSAAGAEDPRVTGPLRVRRAPLRIERDPAGCRAWLADLIGDLQPAELMVDTFPAGILGELADLKLPARLPLRHVARLIRTEALSELFAHSGPPFETCHLVEELADAHREQLAARAGHLMRLELIDPPGDPAACELAAALAARHPAFWLVVHSGPEEEVGALLRFAAEMRSIEGAQVDLVVLTRAPLAVRPAQTFSYDLYPASLLFPQAQRMISAGGFNTLRQAAPWRAKHVVLPFARRWDDQFQRAARYRAG